MSTALTKGFPVVVFGQQLSNSKSRYSLLLSSRGRAKYANEYFKRKHDCDIENVYLLFEIRSGFALNTYSRLRISRHERSGAIRVPLGADCAVSESSFLASVRKISIFYSRYGMEKNK